MFQANEDSMVISLETIAKCMVKQNEMAEKAMKKSQELYKANMTMMKLSQIKPKIILDKELFKSMKEPIPLNEEQLKDLDGT